MDLFVLQAKLAVKFPKVWVKDGAEFDRRHATALWTGEGSKIDVTVDVGDEKMTFEVPAFDQYDMTGLYEFGVHRDLHNFLAENGCYAEAYDGGTYFIYPI